MSLKFLVYASLSTVALSGCGSASFSSGKGSSHPSAAPQPAAAAVPGIAPDAAQPTTGEASTIGKTDPNDPNAAVDAAHSADAGKQADPKSDADKTDGAKKIPEDVLSVGPDLSKVTAAQLADACKNAKLVKSVTQVVDFPKPATTCPWGKDDNLPFDQRNQLIFTARSEQAAALKLPAGAVVCDLAFSFQEAKIRYDDEILLTFDGVVLMASEELAHKGELQIDAAGFTRWNWPDLLKRQYHMGRAHYFVDADCGNDCELPPTETTGTVKLKVKPETLQKIALDVAAKKAAPAPSFAFITLGDNDREIDCLHEDFKFSAQVDYVVTSAAP